MCHSFSLKKTILLKGELHQPCDYITNVYLLHVTDGVTMMSLSAGSQYMTSVAMDCIYQITLNWKLLHKLEKWCIFMFLKQNHARRNHIKWDLPVMYSTVDIKVEWPIALETLKSSGPCCCLQLCPVFLHDTQCILDSVESMCWFSVHWKKRVAIGYVCKLKNCVWGIILYDKEIVQSLVH